MSAFRPSSSDLLTAAEWQEAFKLISAEWEAMSELPLHDPDSRCAYLERRGSLRYSLSALLGREGIDPRIALQTLRRAKKEGEAGS